MVEEQETLTDPADFDVLRSDAKLLFGFVVVFSRDDPEHVGSWLAVGRGAHSAPRLLGRGPARDDDPCTRLVAQRQRPGNNETLAPFVSRSLSRAQLIARAVSSGIQVRRVGRALLRAAEAEGDDLTLRPDDVLEVGSSLALMCTARPALLPGSGPPGFGFEFGQPDPHGLVGESPSMWRLRRAIQEMAPLRGHVLVRGPTGAGKELVAGALHASSGRLGPLIARNAATLPESLIDAELFGNLKGFPNPSMPERPGLVGAAHDGTLFLDEIGDLPLPAQPHLLRVLDRGEYQRLGDSRARFANVRVVAATNRPLDELRPELAARFELELRVPGLSERREDVPLLASWLLRGMREVNTLQSASAPAPAVLTSSFVRQLVTQDLSSNVRGLKRRLREALLPAFSETDSPTHDDETDQHEPGALVERLRSVLEQHGGSIEKSWRPLGLSSRHALARLCKKHGIVLSRR
jgi:transcriptional regulator of acetoin/glycerol metabolism